MFVQLRDLLNRTTILRDDVLVIEKNQGQFSVAGFFLVRFKEAVETADRFLRHIGHRAGTVEHHRDFCQFRVWCFYRFIVHAGNNQTTRSLSMIRRTFISTWRAIL